MGLFSKKAKAQPAALTQPPQPASAPAMVAQASKSSKRSKPPKPPKPPKAAKEPKRRKEPKPPKAEKPAKAAKPGKNKGKAVDPAEFVALRFEMVDLRARLEASENSKAAVESRLAALDAGGSLTARAPLGGGGDDLTSRIAQFEAQLGAVAAAAAAASATAENAAAKAMTAASMAMKPDPPQPSAPPLTAAPSGPVAHDPVLLARVDELMARIEATPSTERLVALEARVESAGDTGRLVEIEARIAELAAKVTETTSLPPLSAFSTGESDPAITARVDEISERLGKLDSLASQVAKLAGRVEASERIAEQIEDRLNSVSTELGNQVGELGRELDGLATTTTQSGDGHKAGSNGRVDKDLLAKLQDAQIKLAAEQARYEIAFRQDLATLAEHVRRTKRD